MPSSPDESVRVAFTQTARSTLGLSPSSCSLARVPLTKVSFACLSQEKYFMENVAIGERLSAVGEEAYVPAALSFFRALRIYPSPPELMQSKRR